MIRVKKTAVLVLVCLTFLCAISVGAQCVTQTKRVSALNKVGEDNGQKIPLILIHGIHGLAPDEERTKKNHYWDEFIAKFDSDFELMSKYSLYVFQYYSDKELVQDIACELGFFIEEKIPDRPHVILAHSMGGLVAKAYMVYFQHKNGKWAGDSVLGAITLATPHHGTPGANSLKTFENYMKFGWKSVFGSVNLFYWKKNTNDWMSPQMLNSGNPNRSDLRWDNFDKAIPLDKRDDMNLWLPHANQRFQNYASKVILYAGIAEIKNDASSPGKALSLLPKIRTAGNHIQLSYTNDILVNGFSAKFGNTDGLVPYVSALLCTDEYVFVNLITDVVCSSKFKVRRFEPFVSGKPAEVPEEKLPFNTLSIIRKKVDGYDHEDMLTNPHVLDYVLLDLRKIAKIPVKNEPPPTVPLSKIPTLFLFDVSGSMNDNGKIGQARDAGLDALREMRENAETPAPPVSIMTFSGDNCGGRVTQKILNFTGNLTDAESTMRSRLPAPNGGTPLPQARDAAYNDMLGYLNSNANFREGKIILLSDGQSTCGAIRPPNVYSIRRTDILVSRAGNSRIRFLTIGFDVPAGSEAERDLQYLASETGGKYYNAADRKQLIRAFQKQVRRFVPRPCNPTNADFAAGLRAFAELDYPAALEAFRRYSAANPRDWCGAYNLALAYEANDRYKKAADTYQLYLKSAPNSPDRARIEQKIVELRQDYLDQLDYYANLMQSDVDYLKRYYQSIFNRASADLGEEFGGFVYEKRGFYANLPEVLEIDARWLSNDSKDISSSVDVLAKRRTLATFDRDAVSLLTTPISLIEDLVARIRNFRAGNVQ